MMECTQATAADVPGMGKLFLESFSQSVAHICGNVPHDAAIEDLFSCIYQAEPAAAFVARDAAGRVVGYVLAPAQISKLWRHAVFGGHLFRWLWRWLKGDYGFGLYPVKKMFNNKLAFFRSAFTPQVYADARILSVAVSAKARGHGLATKLMFCALQYFKDQRIPLVRLEVRPDNFPAVHVYKKLGFKEAGYTRDSQGDWLIMLKEMEH